MTFYIGFYLCLLGLIILNKYTGKNIFIKIIFIALFIISAIRFDVGKDYSTYYKVIINYNYIYELEFNRLELFNKIIIYIARFFNYPQLYFIITSSIIYWCIYRSIEKLSKNNAISIMVFLGFPIFFIATFSAVRQYVAVSIVLYSLISIKEMRIKKFLALCLCATLFHKSAFISIIIYPLYFIRINKYVMLLASILIPFIGDYINKIISFFIDINYLNFGDLGEGRKILITISVISITCIMFKEKLCKVNKINNLYINMLFIGQIIMSTFLKNGDTGTRFSVYFVQVVMFIVPMYVYIFKMNSRLIINYLIYVLCIFLFILTIKAKSTNTMATQIIPYRVYFNNSVEDLVYD